MAFRELRDPLACEYRSRGLSLSNGFWNSLGSLTNTATGPAAPLLCRNKRIKDKGFGVFNTLCGHAPNAHTNFIVEEAIVRVRAYYSDLRGPAVSKSVLLSSQITLVPIYRPRRVEGLVGPGAGIEPVSDLVIAAPHTTTPLVP